MRRLRARIDRELEQAKAKPLKALAPRRESSERHSGRGNETDGEVENNIPPELVTLWRKRAAGVKGSTRRTRTEEFLEWAAEHRALVAEHLRREVDADVLALEREERRRWKVEAEDARREKREQAAARREAKASTTAAKAAARAPKRKEPTRIATPDDVRAMIAAEWAISNAKRDKKFAAQDRARARKIERKSAEIAQRRAEFLTEDRARRPSFVPF
jgi:hypothetical protein